MNRFPKHCQPIAHRQRLHGYHATIGLHAPAIREHLPQVRCDPVHLQVRHDHGGHESQRGASFAVDDTPHEDRVGAAAAIVERAMAIPRRSCHSHVVRVAVAFRGLSRGERPLVSRRVVVAEHPIEAGVGGRPADAKRHRDSRLSHRFEQ